MTEEDDKLIDDYFGQEMSSIELDGFTKELETNEELKAAFELRQLSAAAFQREQLQAFKKEMQERYVLEKPVKAVPKTIRIRPYVWAIAASIAIIIGFFMWQLWDNSSHSKQLFAQYDMEEVYPHTRYALVNDGTFHKSIVGSEEFNELKKEGLKAFDLKNWDQAIKLFTQYLAKAEPSVEDTPDEINLINLYLGRAFFENGETDKAIETLQEAVDGVVDEVNYGILKEFMQWQLALAHLKNNDNTSAKQILEGLKNAQHPTIKLQAPNFLNDLK